ncbi:uncharacterized protein LOC124679334 [Lolium rigidum]|uniref:uncharacterized protein LOC124679334 n=1 Tax=Lolium rigidum TaxID=89674 RepID=UPI001F5D0F4D|nr:uncharacterized protein LOC124679334 [Lolium rigidum]
MFKVNLGGTPHSLRETNFESLAAKELRVGSSHRPDPFVHQFFLMQERFRGYLVIVGGKAAGAGTSDSAITLLSRGDGECIKSPWRKLQERSRGRIEQGSKATYAVRTVMLEVIFGGSNGG